MPAPTISKADVLAMLRRLPDDVSIHEIEYHVTVMAAVQEGIEAIEAGRAVTQAEVEYLMEQWQDDE